MINGDVQFFNRLAVDRRRAQVRARIVTFDVNSLAVLDDRQHEVSCRKNGSRKLKVDSRVRSDGGVSVTVDLE
jgi:hypothetical protein